MTTVNEIIYKSHQYRQDYLKDIFKANLASYEYHCEKLSLKSNYFEGLGLSKRIKGNELRSNKNHMLSMNSMSCLMAEYGGMDAVLSHYMAEKYAILIEESKTIEELENILKEFVYVYLDPSNRLISDSSMPLSSQVNHFIENNFMLKINVQEIANHFNFSREYLSRSYKEDTGITIQDKIEITRINEAKNLLKESNLSITEIAIFIGYNSSQYFSQVFRKNTGYSPSNYRKINKK